MPNINESKLTSLRAKGYTGDATVEALVAEVRENLLSQYSGGGEDVENVWWVILKNAGEALGVEFEDKIIEELDKYL